jgi:hypothetical protein
MGMVMEAVKNLKTALQKSLLQQVGMLFRGFRQQNSLGEGPLLLFFVQFT